MGCNTSSSTPNGTAQPSARSDSALTSQEAKSLVLNQTQRWSRDSVYQSCMPLAFALPTAWAGKALTKPFIGWPYPTYSLDLNNFNITPQSKVESPPISTTLVAFLHHTWHTGHTLSTHWAITSKQCKKAARRWTRSVLFSHLWK